MHRYIVKRLLLAIPTLVGAAALVFVLMRLIPGDVCVVRLGAGGTHVDPASVAACRKSTRPIGFAAGGLPSCPVMTPRRRRPS